MEQAIFRFCPEGAKKRHTCEGTQMTLFKKAHSVHRRRLKKKNLTCALDRHENGGGKSVPREPYIVCNASNTLKQVFAPLYK
jgi:hypothetical protein